MGTHSGQVRRSGGRGRSIINAVAFLLASASFMAGSMSIAGSEDPDRPAPGGSVPRFPTVRPQDRHVRELLANAMRYVSPENRMVDPISGYPFEGWNQDPARGLYLRSFTQLTAIGQYMELLANVAAGHCDTPYLSRSQALEGLIRLVRSLRQDQ